MTMTRTALALTVLLAGSAASAQPTVYVPSGPEPRFGGEFTLSQFGAVAGYWPTECRTWRIKAQDHRGGPMADAALTATLKRFVSGVISERPAYDDLSPAMANAVRQNLPTYWASLNRMGYASVAKKIDKDADGDDVYVVYQRGGQSHWNVAVNGDGKIESAFVCTGDGI